MELDFSKPELLQTRGGYEFRIHANDLWGNYPIAISLMVDGKWTLKTVNKQGYCVSKQSPTEYDLIPKPQRVTGWVVVFADGSIGCLHETREEATHNDGPGIGQIYIDAEVQK